MNVLYITLRADHGGGSKHVNSLVHCLCDEIKLYVACPDEPPYWTRYSEEIGADRMCRLPHRKFSIQALVRLLKFVKANHIDIIHSHGKGAGLYSRLCALLCSVKCVHTFHGIHVEEYNALMRWMYCYYERVFSRLTEGLISVSGSESQTILDLGLTRPDKLHIIPNGVSVSDMQDSILKPRPPLPIIHVSRFDYAKNSELLIDIWRCMKQNTELYKLIILGDGPGRKTLQEYAVRHGLPWVFKGFVSDVSEYLKNAFVLLSTSRWEGMPLAVLEAMAHSIPVIATNVVGNRDIVKEGHNGCLYDRPEQVLHCLKSVEATWDQMSNNAYLFVKEDYSEDQMAQRTLAIYHSITS